MHSKDLDGTFTSSHVINVDFFHENNRALIAPNPMESQVQMHYFSDTEEYLSLKVVDIMGRTIKEERIPVLPSQHILSVDLEDTHSCVYLLSLNGIGYKETLTFVK